jgi:multidrug efflux pump subunit AcrA (membrane-fusion protein)
MLLVEEGEERYAVVATWPDGSRGVADLAAIGPALKQRRGIVHYVPDGAGPPRYACLAYPVEVDGRPRAIVVIQVAMAADLQSTMDQLRWGAGWLETLLRRIQNQDDDARIKRMAVAMDVLGGAGEHRELFACAVAVANELAVQLSCARVSIGVMRGNRVRLVAISNSAVVEKKTTLVEAIENAMEEASIQRQTIATPAISSLDPRVALAHQELIRRTASVSVASVIMPSADRVVGVITLERDSGKSFDAPTAHLVEAVAHLLGPLVEMKAERRHLIGGRLVDALGASCTALVGRRRPIVKLAAAAAIGVLTYGAFAQGEFRISGKALIEGVIQRAAVAPFDGFVSTAPVRAGDIVTAGQILATLDDRELTLELLRVRSVFEQQVVKYSDAIGERDPVAARLAAALIEQSKAEIAQVEDKLGRAKIAAPFSGVVVSGDLRQMLGSPVNKGQVLFQLAPLDSFRVILQVDERDISFVSAGQTGQLVLTGFSGRSFPFRVKAVTPVATASEGRNYFSVEAEIEYADEQLRPGMEGVGKISMERRRLLWIWTRSLVEWAQITAWKWAP